MANLKRGDIATFDQIQEGEWFLSGGVVGMKVFTAEGDRLEDVQNNLVIYLTQFTGERLFEVAHLDDDGTRAVPQVTVYSDNDKVTYLGRLPWNWATMEIEVAKYFDTPYSGDD